MVLVDTSVKVSDFGSAPNNDNISLLFLILPQASSPMTKG